MESIYSCVDGSKFTKSVCEYGIFFAKESNIPLTILNTVEHSHKPKKQDLSGNIGLGERDDLLDEYSKEEQKLSKDLIEKGREVLKSSKELVEKSGVDATTKQRHGTLYENLIDIEQQIRLLIIGLQGEDKQGENIGVGEQVETIIRSLHVPTLLINQSFKKIESVVIAFDGSTSSKKALQLVSDSPLVKDIKRYVVNVNKDKTKSETILKQAQELVKESNIEIETVSIEGEPLEELINFQQEVNADLIAMGAFSHNRLRDALFGSFTSKMLAKTKSPLLLLR